MVGKGEKEINKYVNGGRDRERFYVLVARKNLGAATESI